MRRVSGPYYSGNYLRFTGDCLIGPIDCGANLWGRDRPVTYLLLGYLAACRPCKALDTNLLRGHQPLQPLQPIPPGSYRTSAAGCCCGPAGTSCSTSRGKCSSRRVGWSGVEMTDLAGPGRQDCDNHGETIQRDTTTVFGEKGGLEAGLQKKKNLSWSSIFFNQNCPMKRVCCNFGKMWQMCVFLCFSPITPKKFTLFNSYTIIIGQ